MATTYLGMTLPSVSITAGPQWATELNAALTVVDEHDHTSGKGQRIVPAAININAELTFNDNPLTDAGYLGMFNNPSPLASSILNTMYVSGGELYFNDGAGTALQLTDSGTPVSTNGFYGDYASTGTQTSYDDAAKLYSFKDSNTDPASIGLNRLFMENGLVGTPALSFTSDTDTGMYLAAAADVRIAAAGADVAQFNASGLSVTGNIAVSGTVDGRDVAADGTQLDTNTANIATNTADITTNAVDITTNSADIAANTANITTNTADIATNTANIATNAADIVTNAADIANNTANIATNTTDIATNTTNIATNAADITTNSADIATNTTNIATNTANIATNTADITTNIGNIATNSSDIATNTADITANAGNIATNTTDIAINTGNIATNTADIATNTADIAANTADIATNTASIATNAGNIATNTSDIATNAGDISAHTSASTDVHGIGAGNSVVGTGTSQTLTDKTLSKFKYDLSATLAISANAIAKPDATVMNVSSGTGPISSVTGGATGDVKVLTNNTGADLTISNNDAANGIVTGTGNEIVLGNDSSITLYYEVDRWKVIGGAGGGGLNLAAATTTLTAKNSTHYLVDSTGGAFTITLPAGSTGAVIRFSDVVGNWATDNVTLDPDGSETIDGDTDLILDVDNTWVQLMWDGTEWKTDDVFAARATDITGDLTVNGDLTVDTDTLFVDSTNDRVGIGTLTPSQPLQVDGRASFGTDTTGGVDIYGDGLGRGRIFFQDSAQLWIGNNANNTAYVVDADGSLSLYDPSGVLAIATDGSGSVGIGKAPDNALVKLVTKVGSSQTVAYSAEPGATIGTSSFTGLRIMNFGATLTTASFSSINRGGSFGESGFLYMRQSDTGSQYMWFKSDATVLTSTNGTNVGTDTGTVVGSQTSDERLKSNIEPIPYGLKEVLKLKPIKYEMFGKTDIGFGAQTTQPIIPESVYNTGDLIDKNDENSPADKLAMEYVRIIPVLTKAIQELKAENDELKSRIEALEAQ